MSPRRGTALTARLRVLGSAALLAALPGAAAIVPGPASASAAGTVHAAAARLDPYATPSTGGVRQKPTRTGPLSGRTIVIDPGHNGRLSRANNTLVPAGNGKRKPCNTSGTAGSGGSEHAFTWNMGERLATALRSKGATVILTRPNDRGVGPCVNERAAIGNRARADLILSIHADGNTSARARGFHIITSTTMTGGRPTQTASTRYALQVRSAMQRVGMPRSTYLGGGTAFTPRTDIAGLNLSQRPAIMLEVGNMRHPADAKLMATPTFRTRTVNALTDATIATLRK